MGYVSFWFSFRNISPKIPDRSGGRKGSSFFETEAIMKYPIADVISSAFHFCTGSFL
ncbi:MAG: hypothetical protein FD166_3260 [Bacteroidetes bacterium]|nr:MAG: hypothetical protein FD166_3260 [Bacteroidota bacterium]